MTDFMSDVNISIDVSATRLKDVFLPTLTGDTPSNHVTALASGIKQDVTDKNITNSKENNKEKKEKKKTKKTKKEKKKN